MRLELLGREKANVARLFAGTLSLLRRYLLSRHIYVSSAILAQFGMANESATIVQKLWNYCNVLRDDGVSYGDYVEQLTYLLFLKMADEQTKPPFNRPSGIPITPTS